jgi:hypothetical protein
MGRVVVGVGNGGRVNNRVDAAHQRICVAGIGEVGLHVVGLARIGAFEGAALEIGGADLVAALQ